MRKRMMLTLAVATVTLAGGLLVASVPSASAASCYGSAKAIEGVDDNGHWPPNGSTYTTSNCNDINVKMTRTMDVKTCFAPASGGYYCNAWRTVYANTWGLAATDVRDGTRFWLLFNTTTDVRGLAAY